MSRIRLIHGECIEAMRQLEDCSIDAVCTDPPYGIRFMGKAWDGADIDKRVAARRAAPSTDPSAGPNGGHKSKAAEAGQYDQSLKGSRAFQVWCEEWARECLRVLKPGGYLLAFGGSRMFHRLAAGIEDAGFELRDTVLNLHDGTVQVRDCPWLAAWSFGSGFPKSHNPDPFSIIETRREVSGVGTALKPAFEPIVMARKPLDGTVANNVLTHGTGALNIEASRVPTDENLSGGAYAEAGSRAQSPAMRQGSGGMNQPGKTVGKEFVQPVGRWPANVVTDGSEAAMSVFPSAGGAKSPVKGTEPSSSTSNTYGKFKRATSDRTGEASANSSNEGVVGFKMKPGARRLDEGSAARFFYCAKTSAQDRHEGLEHPGKQFEMGRLPHHGEKVNAEGKGNHHPTVKPTELMRYLVRMVTPPGGTVLDPFAGSGSTLKAAELEGFNAIGIEREAEFVAIAEKRVAVGQPLLRDVTVEVMP